MSLSLKAGSPARGDVGGRYGPKCSSGCRDGCTKRQIGQRRALTRLAQLPLAYTVIGRMMGAGRKKSFDLVGA